jgi:electron transfer flavoprotein beta subunit
LPPVNSIVCVKPVPDPRHWSELALDSATKTLRREGIPSVLNPLDKHALEEALRIKERLGDTVTAISMAPLTATESLREAIAIGADDAVLLSDKSFAGADTLATAYVLAAAIKKLGKFDLILCGNQSLDGGTGQVGPEIAEFLGVPHVTYARKIEILERGIVRVERALEYGYMVIEARMPLVLSVVKEINVPRHVSLMRISEAMQAEVRVWTSRDLDLDSSRIGLSGSPTQVADLFLPVMKRRGEMMSGAPDAVSKLLIQRLRELGVL